ncbi:hypothetical protein KMI1_5 [Klebsiella phage KMI1]|uniref:Uncharacterized protein n=1 Tax=Klebsiella phage KMI1 TaxID=2589653 RepID=A0A514U6A0_9CAUD|nr:hypothetical protein KMI1_5 [Klebsiella phage KMI1]
MADQTKWLFDGSTSQWMRLGATERRLLDVTGLHVVMHDNPFILCVDFFVYKPHPDGDVLLIKKTFSRWSIDSASDWLAKLTADYASWK